MTTIYLWGKNAEDKKDELAKDLKMRWNRKKKLFYRQKANKLVLKKIMNFCLKNKINYRTEEGQSYEVIDSEPIETSSRELRDWGPDISKGTGSIDEVDYEQMWEEYKEGPEEE